MDDNIINLELNENGVYDVTNDTIENIDDTEESVYNNEFQQHTPVDDFVNGIFMGLNVSNTIHRLIRKVL